MSFQQLADGPFKHWSVGEKAIQGAFLRRGFRRYVALSKPPLSERNQARRLEWAQEHVNWTREQWNAILWTDETWVTGYHRKHYVTRQIGEAYDQTCVNEKVRRPRGWMFWASFHDHIKGPCLFWEKSWGTINAASYRERIVPLIDDWMRNRQELVLMQDNAPGHTAAATLLDLQRRGIDVIDWPAFSPDLNPIENVWNKMKDYIQRQLRGQRNPALGRLRILVQEAWDQITIEQLDALVNSMGERCQAVIQAQGGHTHY